MDPAIYFQQQQYIQHLHQNIQQCNHQMQQLQQQLLTTLGQNQTLIVQKLQIQKIKARTISPQTKLYKGRYQRKQQMKEVLETVFKDVLSADTKVVSVHFEGH